jgi:hypothetical protein
MFYGSETGRPNRVAYAPGHRSAAEELVREELFLLQPLELVEVPAAELGEWNVVASLARPETVSDGVLEWAKQELRVQRISAREECKKSQLDGKTGWRLPTLPEVRALIRGCSSAGTCGHLATDAASCRKCPAVNVQFCTHPIGLPVGCGTLYADHPDSRKLWTLNFNEAQLRVEGERQAVDVICVRSAK